MKKQKAQSVVEYFVLFSILAGVTFLTFSKFLPEVQKAGSEVFQVATEKLKGEDKPMGIGTTDPNISWSMAERMEERE